MLNGHRSREPYLSLGEINPSALLTEVIPLVYCLVRCEKHRSFKLDFLYDATACTAAYFV
jgi:hypothetical protein